MSTINEIWDSRGIKPTVWQTNLQYLIATITIFAVGMISVVLVTVFKETDNSILITAIIGFTGTTLGSVLAFMKSQETHASVNSRMDDFIKKFESASIAKQTLARSEGLHEGRSQGRASADARTDVLAGHSTSTPITPSLVQPIAESNVLKDIAMNTKETVDTLKEIKDK